MQLDGLASLPIVNEDGTMTDAFRGFLLKVESYLPKFGEGSPEGVVEAPLYSLYIDINAVVAPIEYRKVSAKVDGDKSKGWEAV